MQPGSHDKPNSATQGLFLISAPSLNLLSFLGSLPSSAWLAVSMLVLLLFPFCIFFSWCEMNIKALVGQLGGLQQNFIGLHGLLHAHGHRSSSPATTLQSSIGAGGEFSLQGGTPGRVGG